MSNWKDISPEPPERKKRPRPTLYEKTNSKGKKHWLKMEGSAGGWVLYSEYTCNYTDSPAIELTKLLETRNDRIAKELAKQYIH